MALDTLQVRMFGDFSLTLGENEISDRENRSRKSWLLLAYMVYCRTRPITPDELVELLWGHDETSANPLNALKTMLHRVRAALDSLQDGLGHSLILRRRGVYIWNQEFPLELDTDLFEDLCRKGSQEDDPEKKLDLYFQALSLYQGNFLDKLSTEPWVVPLTAYYHNLYLQTVLEALSLLQERERPLDIVAICGPAVQVEPYNEEIHAYYFRALLDIGRQRQVIQEYKLLHQRMLDNFGILPAENLRTLNREAMAQVNDRSITIGMLSEQLKEPTRLPGALICEYDFFKIIYQATTRALARSGDAVHVALISVTGLNGQELNKRSLDIAMDNLQTTIQNRLRRGDIAARCSASQFVVLLPMANYENSQMVCQRVVKAFQRQYPHSPANLEYAVQALEPNV